MSGRCKDCKHWDRETVYAPANWGNCDHNSNGDEDADSGFGYYMDGGSYPSTLVSSCTGPEFGCIHFEHKQA